MKLLLDEMFPAAIARALRAAGYDAIAVQEDNELREMSDTALFAAAQRRERTIVTENVKDFLPLDAESHARTQPHWGLVLTTNQTFPPHRERFIGAMTRALGHLLGPGGALEPDPAVAGPHAGRRRLRVSACSRLDPKRLDAGSGSRIHRWRFSFGVRVAALWPAGWQLPETLYRTTTVT